MSVKLLGTVAIVIIRKVNQYVNKTIFTMSLQRDALLYIRVFFRRHLFQKVLF